MRIAICEDEEFIQNSIEKNIEKCLEITGMAGKCECFVSAEELLEKGNMPYALYILDVEMKKLSGLELAEHIRTEDRNAVILFMTNHSEMMQKAFDVQAFQYLVKPIDEETACRTIVRALHTIKERTNCIQFTDKTKDFIFYYDEIEYIESRRRKIIVHTESGDHEFYGRLDQIEDEMKGSMFVRIHNSYLINMEKLKEVEREKVILRSGAEVPIARSYKKNFNIVYQNFILMKKWGRRR